MAFTFDSTISGLTSNSYATVDGADTYFGGSLDNSIWGSLTTEQKEQVLVMATVRLESETYGGLPTVVEQRLQFPREYLISRYAESYKTKYGSYPSGTDGYHVDNEVPKEIQSACFELALYFSNKENDNLGTADEIDIQQLKSMEVGPLKLTMKDNFLAEELPAKVKRMLVACGPNTWEGGMRIKAIRG